MRDLLIAYASRVRGLRRANPAIIEPALAPSFQRLVEDALPSFPLGAGLSVQPEFQNPGAGRPDIALVRPLTPPRAFIELKAIDKPADPERWRDPHDKRQYERLKELAYWATSNFVDFHFFKRGEAQGRATIVPARALEPTCSDTEAQRLISAHDYEPFFQLLAQLVAAQPPAATNAIQLAELMAHSARLVRGIVGERLEELRIGGVTHHALLDVRETFRDVLYAHPEAGGYSAPDFDTLFSAAFAQTLAFGLLLVREATGASVGVEAWRDMP